MQFYAKHLKILFPFIFSIYRDSRIHNDPYRQTPTKGIEELLLDTLIVRSFCLPHLMCVRVLLVQFPTRIIYAPNSRGFFFIYNSSVLAAADCLVREGYYLER